MCIISAVLGQLWRSYAFRGLRPPLWHWRTPAGQEVDAVIEEGGGKLTAVECKLSEHPSGWDCSGIRSLRSFYGKDAVPRAFIVCRTPARYEVGDGIEAVSVRELCDILEGG